MIDRFDGDFFFLSNFYPSDIVLASATWPSAEHAFQGMKTTSATHREQVRSAPTPAQAKRRGRSVPLRPRWDEIRDEVMLMVLRAKFTQDATLARRLIETGDARLIEGNTWGDRYWGTVDGVGENRLGGILEHVRAELSALAIHP